MVKIANIMIPSLFKPNFFFEEMITRKDQSFKNDVNENDLHTLMIEITRRIESGEISFEHLKLSKSPMHMNYKPYTEQTFILVKKIIDDLMVGDSIELKHLNIIYKIFSNKIMSL